MRSGVVTIIVFQWDTSGEERYQAIVPNYFRNAHVILFLYSVTDSSSFSKIDSYWLPFASNHGPKDAVRVLIGNKCEENELREVPLEAVKVN